MTPSVPNMMPEPLDHALSPIWRGHFQESLQKIALLQQQITGYKGMIYDLQETLKAIQLHLSVMLESVAEAEGLPKLAGVQYALSADGTVLHRRNV